MPLTRMLALIALLWGCYFLPAYGEDAPFGAGDPMPGAIDAPLEGATPLPEVLTAARLRQSKFRTPATVTVIEGRLIRELGLLNLWEVFRLVPGMTVGVVRSGEPVVSYHGTVASDQRRLQVLVDGRSQYNPSLARVDWNQLPVPLEQIERIEVNRGPNAAAYGSNSFLAVINIITRAPQDSHGVELRAMGGDTGFRNYYGATGDQVGNTHWQLSLLRRESDGFDWRIARDSQGNRIGGRSDFRDGYENTQVNLATSTDLDGANEISFKTGLMDIKDLVDRETGYAGFGPLNDPDETGLDGYAQVRWDHQASNRRFFHLQGYYQRRDREKRWRACLDAPTIAFLGDLEDNFCGDANEDLKEQRTQIEFQQTHLLGNQDQLVYGASYREDRFESETFFNGRERNHLTQVFANLDTSLTTWLSANLGAMWEKDRQAGNFFSPRGALNIRLSEFQALRLVISQANRLPDAFEQSADWGYKARNVTPEDGDIGDRRLLEFRAPGGLEEERILSREISYILQTPLTHGRFNTEVKIFRDSLTQVISGFTNIQEWNLENNLALTQQGAEIEATLDLRRNYLRLSYAYFTQDGRYTGEQEQDPEAQERLLLLESRLNARNSGSVAFIHRFPDQLTAAVSYYLTDSLRDRKFERIDMRVAKQWQVGTGSLELAAIMQHALNDEPLYNRDNNFDSRNHYFAEARLRF
ncbi:MAG: TonB-dependent receptor [Halomonadaceae bacterium]|nr:MAG: TonB-dependent receptor [Halomonadaceae bacterium]